MLALALPAAALAQGQAPAQGTGNGSKPSDSSPASNGAPAKNGAPAAAGTGGKGDGSTPKSNVLEVGPTEETAGRGFYVRGGVGVSMLNEMNLTDNNTRTNIGFEPGFGLSLAGGFKFNRILGIEAELAHRAMSSSEINLSGQQVAGGSTNFSATTALVNIIAELGKTEIRPYFGAGIGMARVSLDDFKTPFSSYSSESKNEFAYQLLVGVGYEVVPGTLLTVDYRWLASDSLYAYGSRGQEVPIDGIRVHSVSAGIRYMF